MHEVTAIRVPFENVNDETVKLVAWLVEEGQEVFEGQMLAEVETSKAIVEMTAPVAGRISLKAKAGEDLRVGVVIAHIGADGKDTVAGQSREREDAEVGGRARQSRAETGEGQDTLPTGVSFSKKALGLIERHKVDPKAFAGRGLVREQHVAEYLAQVSSIKAAPQGLHFALKGLVLDNVTLPDGLADGDRGHLDGEFLHYLSANAEKFSKLSSAEKCAAYREHGAEIGSDVVLGAGTILIAPRIVIETETQFGDNTSIRCRERFHVDGFSSFRGNLSVRGGTVVFGKSIFAGQNIRIGGGGNADPWSLLCVGDGTYVGDDVFVNICRPVVIGEEVFLTQRSILVTHNIGHSILEGYENRFAPIVLEDYSQVGMNCTIYAGASIGKGAIVASNSYVISSIPAGKLAMGVPAKVVKDAVRRPERSRQVQLVHTMVNEYHELLRLKGHPVSELSTRPYHGFGVSQGEKRFQLVFLEDSSPDGADLEVADQIVLWVLEGPSGHVPANWTVMNLLEKKVSGPGGVFVDSTREFLRKRGIRCQPGPWLYKTGLI
ncbi:MAG: biotin/lipoyl-containing protein [Candidatus Acidiferrales bacterium]